MIHPSNLGIIENTLERIAKSLERIEKKLGEED